MMQAIRGQAGSIIVKVLFGLLIVSFGLWGASDYLFFQDRNPRETVVATVGDEQIRGGELRQTLEPAVERMRAQFGGAVDMQLVKQLGVVDNILEQLIDRKLLDQETERLGLDVSDEVIRTAIYENPAFHGPDGRFDRRLFGQVLMMNRLTEDQLVARMRRELPRNDLLQAVTSGIQPPRPLVEALYRHRNERRVADIVSIPVSAIPAVAQPGEAELTQFYEEHSDRFRAPEYRGVTLASLSPGDLKPETGISEEALQREYEERRDDFRVSEQREIQQVLAPTEEKAREAETALAAGREFREVAAEIGMDPDAIELGLLNRQSIPSELGDVAFELPLNQPSAPIRTPFGYHILRVVRIEPGRERSFEEIKPQLAAELQLRQAADRIADLANEADDTLAGGATLEDLQQKFGFKLTPVEALDENGLDPAGARVVLPVAPAEVLTTAFMTAQGEATRVTDTQDGAIYAARVDKVTPSAVRPLEEVRDKVIAAWQAEQRQKDAAKQAEALAAAVTPTAPLATAAGERGLTVQPNATLERTPQPGRSFPPALVSRVFTVQPGETVFVADESGGHVAQLKEIQVPETVPDDEAARLTQLLASEMRLDLAGGFTQGLRRRYPVEIKRDELDRMF
jgi:peptidyl-prolyl cis-trans isomerase D